MRRRCTDDAVLTFEIDEYVYRALRALPFQPGARRPAAPDRLARLTDREREILALVAEGLSNDDIALRLVPSPQTVKTHINRTMVKLAAHDRAQLVVIAYQTGLVRPGADS